ncbi:hypothetical protein K3495_g8839 [Podosphaera aphanis]|nr:hypothetical protein K3495_g8839 [Podosphaera aphanis]
MSENNQDIPMGDDTTTISLSSADLAELLQLLRERKNVPEVSSQTNALEPTKESTMGSIKYVKKETNLPKWNGSLDDFGFFIGRLEMRIEQGLEPFAERGLICLDIIEILPEEKNSRVAAWFEESKAQKTFD